MFEYLRNSVRLEASAVCQLDCVACPSPKAPGKKQKEWGFLSFSDFKRFVNKNPFVRHVELSCFGEIFLNPHLYEIIKLAHKNKITLTALNGVNLNSASDKLLEALVKYEFRYISVSIDGADNKTYKLYRKKGNFLSVIRHIKKINEFKMRYKSMYPILRWQFIVFGHNESQISLARNFAHSLNMEFSVKFNSRKDYAPIKNKDLVRQESLLGVASREEFEKKYKKGYLIQCFQLWKSPQISWDGKLLGCCVNKYGDYGNVFKTGLSSCMQSERFVYVKRMLLGYEKLRGDIPCCKCELFNEKISLRHYIDKMKK